MSDGQEAAYAGWPASTPTTWTDSPFHPGVRHDTAQGEVVFGDNAPMDLPSQLVAIPNSDGLYAWMPYGSGGWGYANCLWIVSGDDAAVIDTPYDGPLTDAMIRAARPVLGSRRVSTVVNTHANGDHSWGNHMFPGATVISTHSGSERLEHEPTPQNMHRLLHETSPDGPLGWYMRRHFGAFDFLSARVPIPTVTFSGHHSFTVGGTDVDLIEVGPAHHSGDLIVRVGDVVCAGDVFFPDDHPSHWSGPIQNVIDANETILDLSPRVIIPGHGGLQSPHELSKHIDYLRTVQREIRMRFEGGLTVREAMDDIFRRAFYPQLRLPERLMIVIAVEYSHLRDGGAADHSIIELAHGAAQWAFDRHSETQLPAV
ncbi:MBL fold metallo-hydrolase [Streptomyces sp. NPDC005900]|uniref:MBL fold metallo-hydrolase n=1 Tax=Streptomyces sp. NPDC005900 TaxID=3154569 RepID=UPI0033F2A0C8